MKKLTAVIAFIIIGLTMPAQTTLTNAVDFTVTDLEGNSHNLFSILNSGKYVCIDFFFTTCGPCQATVPYYKQAYQNYGCNQHEVFFISVDMGDNNAQCAAFETTFLGGPAGYPVISGTDGGGDAVVTAYGINAFPTYILIAPNQAIVEQDMWPIADASTFTSYFSAHQLNQNPCPTGIVNPENLMQANLFPNPATNTLNVNSLLPVQSYSVYDVAGRQILGAQIAQPAEQVAIDIHEIPSGMYFIVLNSEGTSSRLKFNKE